MTRTEIERTTRVTDRAAIRGSYVSGTSDTPLLGMTIGDAFDATVARFPDREALISRQQNLLYTWSELRSEVDRCARGLLALGIRKGDRVGIWAPNRAEWAITQFATAKIGAILVNINPAYRLHELEYALNQSGCSALVTAPNFRATSYLEMLAALCPELERSAPGHLDAPVQRGRGPADRFEDDVGAVRLGRAHDCLDRVGARCRDHGVGRAGRQRPCKRLLPRARHHHLRGPARA